jgi:tetratricopeptide (TPR) repeat protein
MTRWYGAAEADTPHYGEALFAARRNLPGARAELERVVRDETMPAIARASALARLPAHAGPSTLPVVERSLSDPDPLVRTAALEVVSLLEPAARLQLAGPLLEDPVRTVRLRAARSLADVPPGLLTPELRAVLDAGLEAYRAGQLVNAERPESHLNLGTLHAERGEWVDAELAYRTALRIDPSFVPAFVNLADLERARGRDGEGERQLRKALEIEPDNGDVHHALGLWLVRGGRLPDAIAELERAAELRPDLPRYPFVLAIALNDIGESDRALAVLIGAHQRHPGDREILGALVAIYREQGLLDSAAEYAAKLAQLD